MKREKQTEFHYKNVTKKNLKIISVSIDCVYNKI